MSVSIMEYADQLGLDAYGVSFHVGSQNYNVNSWDDAIRDASEVFKTLRSKNIKPSHAQPWWRDAR